MSFRNYDKWAQDFTYDSDPSPSPFTTRSRSPFHSRSPIRRSTSSPPRNTRPIIGDDGWEVIPDHLLKPENWGLPPTSLSTPAPPLQSQDIVNVPGVTRRRLDARRGQIIQFYPDHDPDLINANQLDGLPYILQPSTSSSSPSSFFTPRINKSTAYNAAGGERKPLSLSQSWEQNLLEMAHEYPETLRNWSRVPPGRRGGLKSFGELRGEDDGGQGVGTVTGPGFGAFRRGRDQTSSAPSSTPGYTSGGPGQPLSSGGGGGCGGGGLITTNETPCAIGGGYYSNASSSRQAVKEATIRRDAATKAEQMRKAAELKREEYMKEIRKKERAMEVKEKKETGEIEMERVRLEKLQRDRKARDRKEREWLEKSRDARSAAAEAAKRRDADTMDGQRGRAKGLRERLEREERERAERAKEREGKKREEEEKKILMAEKKRERDREGRDARARETEEKSKGARELARESAERRFKAIERKGQAEHRTKPAPESAPKVTPAKTSRGLTAGPVRAAPKPAPAPARKTTLPPKPTPSKSAPAKTTTLPTPPSPKPAPKKEESEGEDEDESILTPQEMVRKAMARREAAIRALPPGTPETSDDELPPKPSRKPAPAPSKAPIDPAPNPVAKSHVKTAKRTTDKSVEKKAGSSILDPKARAPTFEEFQEMRRKKVEEAKAARMAKKKAEKGEKLEDTFSRLTGRLADGEGTL